jgi:hypothetical protein
VAELGAGPVSPGRPDVVRRRLLVRSTGARQRWGYTAIVPDPPPEVVAAADLEPFYEARQTIEGWRAEATAALPLEGLRSRSCRGLSAFLLDVASCRPLIPTRPGWRGPPLPGNSRSRSPNWPPEMRIYDA